MDFYWRELILALIVKIFEVIYTFCIVVAKVFFSKQFVLFAALNAAVSVTSMPEIPMIGSTFSLLCQVTTEELLCPSGSISLQLPNGAVLSSTILSSTTVLTFQLNSLSADDFGRYFCNASLTSPEFPEVRLLVFEGFDLDRLGM